MWWKHLTKNKAVDAEAREMMSLLGTGAYDAAHEAARRARAKDKARARHYAHVALRIVELTGGEIGADASRNAEADVRPRIVSRL